MLEIVALAVLLAEPEFVDTKLAGHDLFERRFESAALHDVKRELYFVSFEEWERPPDRHSLSLSYSRPGIAPHMGWKETSLTQTKTGKGIGLGFTRARVEGILGQPSEIHYTDGVSQLAYTCTITRSRVRWHYWGAYTFMSGRLVRIYIGAATDN